MFSIGYSFEQLIEINLNKNDCGVFIIHLVKGAGKLLYIQKYILQFFWTDFLNGSML